MSDNIITIYDAATSESIKRPMTSSELAERVKLADADNQRVEANKAIKDSAHSKLAALGLTEEEIAAL
jgi:hypothetical protein